ncbi:hypothetical protein GCM10022268_17350 [Sphingomonas cynarae]|uniref:Bacteriophage tail tape measure N-terminal domain-containing protein n=1 Tax=Sphingomonas cynarae TaxID=930197 RepID=A0ABP7DT62_9SPHN
MLDDDSAGFGVDFVIDTGASFGELDRLTSTMDSAETKILADAARIEKATGSMINLGGATASVTTFGAAATRELLSVGNAARKAEKDGEAMVRQLERQGVSFGKTREEMRGIRAEERALAADRAGNTELAGRIRAAELALYEQEFAAARKIRLEAEAAAQAKEQAAAIAVAAAEREAQAMRAAANAHGMFEAAARRGMAIWREQQAAEAALAKDAVAARLRNEAAAADLANRQHAQLAATLRASHDAMLADAAAAERMRASTDPLYAATKRLNDEIAESTRLYHLGATPPAEYARQQQVLTGRLREVAQAHDTMHTSARRASGTLAQMAPQFNDIATMAALGAPPFQIFASQFGQIVQVAQQAEGGIAGFSKQMGGLALSFAPLIAVAAVAGVAIYRWQDQLNDTAGLKKYAEGLGLTHDEMKKLGEQSITTGDIVAGVWKTITDGAGLDGKGKSIMDYLFSPDDAKQVQGFVASIYGFFAGGYDAIIALWGSMSATVSGYVAAITDAVSRFFAPVVSTAQWAGNAVASIFGKVYEWAAGWVKSIAGFLSPVLSAIGQGPAATAVASAGNTLGKTFGDAYAKRVAGFVSGSNAIVGRIGANTIDAAQARLKKKADELIADRNPTKPKVDRHAEQLVRDAAAIEAQIRNLYALADAYGVSGAAALVAEARVKAESKAIKQRADIEASVNREVRLAIAQRVSDAAKGTAALVDQASAQATVNTLVAGGLVPAERAAELVKDMIADLPLLAAIEAARGRGLTDETARATKALDEQRAARDRLTAAERTAQANTAMAGGRDRLAEQREELRLVGATDMERVRALATLKATQEAQRFNPADRQAYIDQQVAIAVGQQQLTEKQDAYNASLTATADMFDTIDQSAQRAASGMADAFGSVGAAIGDALTVMTGYYADQARLQEAHQAAIRAAGTDEARIARENRQFAIRSSSQQVGAFADMASAARGFFKEGSDGYNALAAAEKAFRLVQFVLSARAIAQDAIETGSKLASSAARTAAGATEAVVNAIKSLPFPLNLAAGAATIAALASIGVGIAGSFGGGGQKPEPSNIGTGTVLGDVDAKSESLKRSIDQLREVDTVTSIFARQMAGSLRSIDDQIGGLAAVLVRSGNIDASAGVTEGFQTNAVGSILKAIVPVFGGALASLFGTKTTVVGSGLYGGAQSVGDILDNGFDASTYSDVQKKKKLFGITTSTKYSTQFTEADAGLENQFTLILRSFASAIAGAADPLGEATSAVQARLNGFVVSIGKIDLKGLTGTQIQEKLEAIFGAAADGMAEAAFPGLTRFQKAGEGAFETLVRVSSTLEAVTTSLDMLGAGVRTMSIDAKLGLVDQFDSIGDLTSAVDAYFGSFYSQAEQAAARQAQMDRVFASLGLSVPATNVAFRQLVEAQDLTTAAGQSTYAALLQLAPAFADLQSAMVGAKSAADVAAERQDLERQLLELRGDTAALRALELAKLDVSNRGLQEQIYAIQDAQGAARAANELRQAWTSVGDSIMDEVRRIRGLTDAAGGDTFASLQGAFNAANSAARGGDMEAAKGLPALSQALLSAAADAATSRQELARIQAQTAAALEATYGVVGSLGSQKATSTTAQVSAAAVAQSTTTPAAAAAANDELISEIKSLRADVVQLRNENNSGQAAIAGNTSRIARVQEDITADSGGRAISVANAA